MRRVLTALIWLTVLLTPVGRLERAPLCAQQAPDLIEVPEYLGALAGRLLGDDGTRELSAKNPSTFAPFIIDTLRTRLARAGSKTNPEKVARALIREANRHELDPLILLAIIAQESSTNPRAVGRRGEIGLMQLKPSTARWVAARERWKQPKKADLFDPVTNIRLGTAYLAYLNHRFPGHRRGFLQAYNLGPSGWLGRRASDYHHRVLRHYRELLFALFHTGPAANRGLQAALQAEADERVDTATRAR